MKRINLEKAWLDCYDFKKIPTAKKVELISKMPSKKMAAEVYTAAMEMRDDGINWFGSDFEDELVEIINHGDLKIEDPKVHITCKDCEEIKNAINSFIEKGGEKDYVV